MSQFQARIANSLDNAYRWPGPFSAWYTGDIQVGHPIDHADHEENSYLRWRNVDIPAGSTINSAYVTLARWFSGTINLQMQVKGIDEDNTADFTNDSSGRAQTTAGVDWDIATITADTDVQSPDIKTVIQEIIDRAGWSSGNSLGLRINDRESTLYNYTGFSDYPNYSAYAPQLTINYTPPATSSISLSPSRSLSASPSASQSPSSSASLSYSLSSSRSPSPSPMPIEQLCMKIAKRNVNVLTNSDVQNLIFDSTKGSLKYFTVDTVDVVVKSNSTDLDIAAKSTITHNLGYYPDAEVYMKTPSGDYIRCPAIMAGASATFKGDFQIKENTIDFYAENSGYPTFSSNQTYTFIYFIFKNNLHL